jgi:hypothetical protein
MNVSLQGARRAARMNWDALEEHRKSTQLLATRIFVAVLAIAAAYVIWHTLAG